MLLPNDCDADRQQDERGPTPLHPDYAERTNAQAAKKEAKTAMTYSPRV
jgi:hypothetical protein